MWYEQVKLNHPELSFDQPYLNAAGSLGFYPDPKLTSAWGGLGAFITNPISFKPRKVSPSRTIIEYPGGFLLHNGFPNPGFTKCIQKYREKWAAAPLPIIVHLLPEEAGRLSEMVRILESCENIQAVELSFPEQMDLQEVIKLVDAAQGELPVLISITPAQSCMWWQALTDFPVSYIRLSEARGRIPGGDDKVVLGRLFGPASFPVALHETSRLASIGLAVIGGGGIFDASAVKAMFAVGAKMIAFDAVFWDGGFSLAAIVGEARQDDQE